MQLTFPNGEHPPVAFDHGEIGIGSRPGQGISLSGRGLAAHHCSLVSDRRGVWLRVPAGTAGVHLNARPVRRAALLHVGDLVCLEQVQIELRENDPARIDTRIPAAPPSPLGESQRVSASRVVVRGLSGAHYGRSFTLTDPKIVGRGPGCDIRIDDAALAERHAQFELHGDRIVLRSLAGGEFISVNGVPVSDAVLSPGDQIVIDQHRFLLEAPGLPVRGQDGGRQGPSIAHTQTMKSMRPPRASGAAREVLDEAEGGDRDPKKAPTDPGALWWLLAAAAVLAAAMTALLVYSPQMGAA
jgi:pSer/pThr/pTyr-binding forkhead associated (FHA) protein